MSIEKNASEHSTICTRFMPPLKGEVGGEAARRGSANIENIMKRFYKKTSPPPIGGPPPLSGEANFLYFLLHKICGHGTPCPYKMRCKIARTITKSIVQKRNNLRTVVLSN